MPDTGDPSGRPARRRLSRSREFDRVYREGRSHATRHLVVYSFPRDADADGPRLGISVGRKVGGAVERNRVKRLLRDAFWSHAADLADGYDFVVVARPASAALAEDAEAMNGAVDELLGGAGLIAGAR